MDTNLLNTTNWVPLNSGIILVSNDEFVLNVNPTIPSENTDVNLGVQ